MAENKRVFNGYGMIALPTPLRTDADGSIPDGELITLNQYLESLARKMNGKVSLGNGDDRSQSGNLDGQWITLVTPSGANTEFEVWHGLGRVAIGYLIGRKTAACDVYDSSIGSWTDSLMLLKATGSSVTINLFVY